MKKVNNKYSRFIPMWLQKLIRLIGNKLSKIFKNIIPILKVIYVITKKLAINNPHMTIGASLGFIASILLYNVPVLGWLIGPLATLFLVLLGAYFGHSYKNSTNKLVSFFNIFVDYIYRIVIAVRQHGCGGSVIVSS